MKKYIFKRLLEVIPVLFIITFVVFLLMYHAGDPVAIMLPEDASPEDREVMRESLGLNEPFFVQYVDFIKNIVTGNFGESIHYKTDAFQLVMERLPNSFQLAGVAMLVALMIAIPLGIWSANKRNSFTDLFITGTSVLGKAMPNFWLGIMLILFFAVTIPIFPVSGSGTVMHMILPAITLGTSIAAEITRLVRSSMLDTLGQDYIRTATSKGASNRKVVFYHAFRNTLIPVLTITTLQLSMLVSGSIITEQVFQWPGIGLLLVQAVNFRDMAVVQAAVFVIAFLVIIINLITDIIYVILDPRIKYS